jgi:hypothetical protein
MVTDREMATEKMSASPSQQAITRLAAYSKAPAL